MSTTYYVACSECVALAKEKWGDDPTQWPVGAHVHADESWEVNPQGLGMAHSSGRWTTPPEMLKDDLVMVDEYGRVWTKKQVEERV